MRTLLPRTGLLIASGALVTLVLTAGPALADQHGHSSGGGRAAAVRSGGGERVQAQARAAAPARGVTAAPRAVVAAPRAVVGSGVYGRAEVAGRGEVYGRGVVSGRTVAPVVVGRAVARPYGAVVGSPRFIGGSRYIGAPLFSRPFFSFRPRYSLGFGLFVGYPVAFPYGYYYSPYDYGYPYPVYGMAEPVPSYPTDGYYGDSGSGYGSVAPGYTDNSANYGGVSFDIQPANAAVYIDGKYVGTVAEFSPQQPPLSLTLGRHHVDIRLQGYQTLSFDVDSVAGQVTPYQGQMQVIR